MRHLCRLAASLAGVFAVVLVASGSAFAVGSTSVVISQVYGGGGNAGAPYQSDFIELFNLSASPVDLTGWSVQYTSATGTGNFGSATNLITPLSGSLASGQYVLVQEASGTTGAPLPAPFISDTTPINMSATGGKVALVSTTTPLGCNGSTASPCSPAALATIVDLIGYDGANFFEGDGAAPTLSNTLAARRADQGCQDTDRNVIDFTAESPAPRTSLSSHECGVVTDAAPAVSSTSPANGANGVSRTANISVTFSEPVTVADGWYSISCPSGIHTAVVTGGPTTYTLDPATDFDLSETCTVTISAANVADVDTVDPPDTMAADYVFSFTTAGPPPPPTKISAIQGAGHTSPKANQDVANVQGIVTGVRTNGFYMQDPDPDADPATAEGIFVFTSSAPTVSVGDAVAVDAHVQEFRPGGASSANLTTTELSAPVIQVQSSGNPLPAATVVGAGGLTPPGQVIEDDGFASFDPASDGIDFWEALEGMRVQLNDAVAVGPTNSFGETPVAPDSTASVRTARGGLLLQADDFNPERVVLDNVITPLPNMNVGDRYAGPIVGVLDYNFGNFFLEVTQGAARVDSGLVRETTADQGPRQLSVGTFNVENLAPSDGPSKFGRLAGLIVDNLKAPDIVTIEEVQDNSGATNNGVVDSNITIDTLVAAIEAAGGPHYEYRYISPVDGQDGGAPGGNIRIAFLYRTDRGVQFVDRPGAGSTTPNSVFTDATGTHLTFSPGRIDPANPAWNDSRKPLAAEFTLRGQTFFLVGDHFNSKGGDDPLMGRFQPPVRSSEVQRHNQAQVENDFIDSILAGDPNANIIVLGDLNDFQFSETVQILTAGGVLHDLIDTLPLNQRYSYEFEGNAQVLDHILVSSSLQGLVDFDVVHVNAEFADQASDHDPSVVRITLNRTPSVDAGGPYTGAEGSTITLAATGSDPDGDALTYAWDLDGDGVFEAAGQSVPFTGLDGPATKTVSVRVSDGDKTATASVDVTVTNVAPTASLDVQSTAVEGATVTGTGSATDPGADTLTFTWSVTKDGVAFASGTGTHPSYVPNDNGTYALTFTATDDDGASGSVTKETVVSNAAPVATLSPAPATVPEGATVTLTGSAVDGGSGDVVTTAWTVTKNGLPFASGTGTSISYTTDDNGAYVVTFTATDDEGGTGTATATTNATNVAPEATFSGGGDVFPFLSFPLSLTGPSDPSPRDTAAGFKYAFDCGSGTLSAFGTSPTVNCAGRAPGTFVVRGAIRDKDGGVTTYSATARSAITPQSLCVLIHRLIHDQQLADKLCAAIDGHKPEKLKKEIDKAGHSISPEVAALLKKLVSLL